MISQKRERNSNEFRKFEKTNHNRLTRLDRMRYRVEGRKMVEKKWRGLGSARFVVFGFAIGPAEQGAKYAESR